MFSIAARLEQPGRAKEREMVTDCGLALRQSFAESGDVQFPFTGETEQNLKAGFVCQQLQDLDQAAFELIRDARDGSASVVSGRFKQFRGHRSSFLKSSPQFRPAGRRRI
jgi:hypothetical protein